MRDGAKLFTVVFKPRSVSRRYPILFQRTPYNATKYPTERLDKYWTHLLHEKFIFVFQDVRGKYMSQGEFINMRPHLSVKTSSEDIDESSDSYDSIEWLINNIADNNGKVGIWGISYPGFYAAMASMSGHPALVAVSPQAPIANWFVGDDFHHNGAFNLPLAFNFFASFGISRQGLTSSSNPKFDHGTPDGYHFFLEMGPLKKANALYFKGDIPFWNDLMKHGSYDDFWQARNTLQHFENVQPAVLIVGGWFDAENCYGALNTYASIEKKNPEGSNRLVMGPWFHGGWVRSDGSLLGNIHFGSSTGAYYVEHIELPFFQYYLKEEGVLNLPEAYVFETGRNQWHQLASWPPGNTRPVRLYLHADHVLSLEEPTGQSEHLFDEYVSDPEKPVPFTAEICTSMIREYMVEDQRFAASRPDVLVYQSQPLREDFTIAGPVFVDLYVSTSGSDSDWIVKLIDVFPNNAPEWQNKQARVNMGGFQMLLRGDIMRAKFRNSYEKPEPMIPGQITKITFSMNDVFHTFKKNHKIMIQVQSTWFPLFDRNPQQYIDIYQAVEDDFHKAIQRVYHSKRFASNIKVLVRQ
jgi:putative CocE/NonD family hydrolase